MLEVDRLAEITAACERPAATPDAENYRAMCNELLDQVAEQADMNNLHLHRLIAEHGQMRNDDLVDTSRKTQSWLMRVSAAARSPRR